MVFTFNILCVSMLKLFGFIPFCTLPCLCCQFVGGCWHYTEGYGA
jgi:nitrate reductase NapE component